LKFNIRMIKSIKALVFVLFVILRSHAVEQQSSDYKSAIEIIKVQEMLFDISGEAMTSYDFKIFKEVFMKTDHILPSIILSYMPSMEDRFLILKLAYKEADQLGLEYDQALFSEVVHKVKNGGMDKENSERLDVEIKLQLRAMALLTIKEKQFQDKNTMLSWMQVLKRKYLMNVKSEDFKNKLSFRI